MRSDDAIESDQTWAAGGGEAKSEREVKGRNFDRARGQNSARSVSHFQLLPYTPKTQNIGDRSCDLV